MKHIFVSARIRTLTVFSLVAAIVFAVCISTDFSSSAQKQFSKDELAPEAGNISGRVFQDFNGNGTYDTTLTIGNNGVGTIPVAIDRGIANVEVRAYNAAGTNVTTGGVVLTAASTGLYTLTTNDAGSGPYRVEFTALPTGYLPSARSKSSVGSGTATNSGSTTQFVSTPGTNVNLAVNYPTDYSQNNPEIVASMYAEDDNINGVNNGQSVMVSFPYSSGSTDATTGAIEAFFDAPTVNPLDVAANQLGTTYGLAYARRTRTVYAAAFFKRHAGFGPQGPNAIYRVSRTGAGSVTGFFTVPGAATNGHDTTNYNRDNGNNPIVNPNGGWNNVGTTSLGGVALSEDESVLYAMNLENRTLYALNATTGAQIASQAVPTAGVPLPTGTCAAADVRPFAVTMYHGQLYVGMVCSAQSTGNVDTFTDTNGNGRWDQGDYYIDINQNGTRDAATESYFELTNNAVYNAPEPFTDTDGNGVYNLGDARGLRAYVYTVNPTTLAFGAAPVFQMPLNYRRGLSTHTQNAMGAWRPWSAVYRNAMDNINPTIAPFNNRTIYSQPMLTDIAFDNGNLILAFRDRVSDQVGNGSLSNPNDAINTNFYQPRTSGDVIRACGTQNTWTVEANGRCGGTGNAPQNVAEGPGNAEFYFGDAYDIAGDFISPAVTVTGKGGNHDDTGNGGVEMLPGAPDVIISNFDPIPNIANMLHDGGIRWLNNTTGAFTKGYRLYDGVGNDIGVFGKAGGIGGSLTLLSDPAPIEIGNRIWRDINANGVQDPGEAGIPNVMVRLYSAGAPANVCRTYADTFPAIAYNGSTGNADWSTTPWTEINDDGNAAAGNVQIVNDLGSNAARLDQTIRGLSRPVNLAFATTATLSFDFRRNASQSATVEYTTNGTTWTGLQTFAAGTDAGYQTASVSLPLTATGIRFFNAAANGAGNQFFADNVTVTACGNTAITDANGEYYFPGVSPSTAYQIRLDRPADYASGGPLFNLLLTRVNETSQLGDDDSSDSDAITVGNPVGSPAGNFAVISWTTGGPGSNNHTLDVGFAAPPTSANVSVEGRVLLAAGNGIRNATVILTEADGTQHTAVTGTFGYYRFGDVEAGQTVVVSIRSKRFTFNPSSRVVNVADAVTDLNFIAQE